MGIGTRLRICPAASAPSVGAISARLINTDVIVAKALAPAPARNGQNVAVTNRPEIPRDLNLSGLSLADFGLTE